MSLRKKYRLFREQVKQEFHAHIDPLLSFEQVRLLDTCKQHLSYTRLRHSLDVAYLSFYLARLFGWNSGETARAALLHDLFFHREGDKAYSLLRSHPAMAVENAKKICTLTPREEDIILKHMWLLTLSPPRYKEGFIVTFVDKYCASREMLISVFTRRKMRCVYEY